MAGNDGLSVYRFQEKRRSEKKKVLLEELAVKKRQKELVSLKLFVVFHCFLLRLFYLKRMPSNAALKLK